MNLNLELELITDVSLSTANHTLGDPETHLCIPGRTLWGAAASSAYRKSNISEDEAFRLFHQGAVKVLDAVPLVDNHRAVPIPRNWHKPKDSKTDQVHNFCIREVREELRSQQCKPLGEGWVLSDGREVHIETNYTLRSAVDASGRAREGILYGVSAIRAGNLFTSQLIGDAKDVETVAALLVGQELRLGRSRNAEMGLVKIRKCSSDPVGLESGKAQSKTISFLCSSRCVFYDPSSGAPTFTPSGTQVGLDAHWKIDLESSFIRTTRVVHFNSKRGRPESERFAIERGSVLTFTTDSHAVDIQSVVERTMHGIGSHCGEGYGQVIVSPSWVTQRQATLREKQRPTRSQSAPEPTDPLFQWVKKQAKEQKQIIESLNEVQNKAADLRACKVPPSQWGEIRRMAREARFRKDSDEKLISRVEKYLMEGKRNLSRPWKRARPTLIEAMKNYKSGPLPTYLEILAGSCMRPAGNVSSEMEESRR